MGESACDPHLRILFINRFFFPDQSATSQMLTDLAEDLARRGHRVTVIAGSLTHENPPRPLPQRESWNGVEVRRVRTSRFGKESLLGRFLDFASFFPGALIRGLRIARPEVVVALSDPPMLVALGALLSRLRGAKLVHWAHDIYPDVAVAAGVMQGGTPADRLLSRIARWALGNADAVVAIGEVMAERLREKGVAPDRVRVVHNWADGQSIRPLPHRENSLRRNYGWDGKFVVMYSGNMGVAHDFSPLYGAMKGLAGEDRIVFAFVGEGRRLGEIRSFVEKEGIGNACFLPPQDRGLLRESLGAADLHMIALSPKMGGLVVPSKLYGILAAGRPALYLGTEGEEVGRILMEHGCGLSARDAETVESGIRRLSGNPRLCEEMGRKARETFDALFGRERAVQEFESALVATARAG